MRLVKGIATVISANDARIQFNLKPGHFGWFAYFNGYFCEQDGRIKWL